MKTLTLILVLLALLVWGSNVLAANPGDAQFMQRWKAVQSEQRRDSDALSRIDRSEGAVTAQPTTPPVDQGTPYLPSGSGPQRCLVCLQ